MEQASAIDNLLFHDTYKFSQLMYQSNIDKTFSEYQREFPRYKSIRTGNLGFSVPNVYGLVEIHYAKCKVILVVFRGSQFTEDWEANFNVRFVDTKNGLLHKGFSDRANVVHLDLLRHFMRDGKIIVFTGHSLGGAAAQICARNYISLLETSAEATEVYIKTKFLCLTYASPLVGDASWRYGIDATYKGLLKTRFIHIVDEYDIVPRCLSLLWNVLSDFTDFVFNIFAILVNDAMNLVGDHIAYFTDAKGLMADIVKYIGDAFESLNFDVAKKIVNFMEISVKGIKKICKWVPGGTFLQISNGVLSQIEFDVYMEKKLDLVNGAVYMKAHKLSNYYANCEVLFQTLAIASDDAANSKTPKSSNGSTAAPASTSSTPGAPASAKAAIANAAVSAATTVLKLLTPASPASVAAGLASTRIGVALTGTGTAATATSTTATAATATSAAATAATATATRAAADLEGSNIDEGNAKAAEKSGNDVSPICGCVELDRGELQAVTLLNGKLSVCKIQITIFGLNLLQVQKISISGDLFNEIAVVESVPIDETQRDMDQIVFVVEKRANGNPRSSDRTMVCNVTVKDCFGKDHSYSIRKNNGIPFTTKDQYFGSIISASPVELVKLAALVPILAHDDSISRMDCLLKAIAAVSQLTAAVPFEIILLPIALGIPLSSFVTSQLNRIKKPNMKSQVCLYIIQSALKGIGPQIQKLKLQLDEMRNNPSAVPPAASTESMQGDLNITTQLVDNVSKAIKAIDDGAIEFTPLKPSVSSVPTSPTKEQTEEAKMTAAIENLEHFQTIMTNQIRILMQANDDIPLFSRETLESTIGDTDDAQPFMSMGSFIKETREKVVLDKNTLIDLLETPMDDSSKSTYIVEAEEKTNHHMLDVMATANLLVGFIDPIALSKDAMDKTKNPMLCAFRDVNMANFEQRWNQHIDYTRELLWAHTKGYFANENDVVLHRIRRAEAYHNIGIVPKMLTSYNDTVSGIYGMLGLGEVPESGFNAPMEIAIAEFCAKKRISYKCNPAEIEKCWDTTFNPLVANADTIKREEAFARIDKRDRFMFCCKLKLVLIVERIRSALVQLNIVGFFGTSAAGKSSAIDKLGIPGIISGAEVGHRTSFPGFYRFPANEKYIILDTVGFKLADDKNGEYLKTCFDLNDNLRLLCHIQVNVVPINYNRASINENKLADMTSVNLEDTKGSGVRILTCFNKIDVILNGRKAQNKLLKVKKKLIMLDIFREVGAPCRLTPALPDVKDSKEYEYDVPVPCTYEPFPRWLTCWASFSDSSDEDELEFFGDFSPVQLERMRANGVRTVSDIKKWLEDGMVEHNI